MSDIEESELPQLTDKQLKFVMCKAEGMNNSDAYRQAYNTANMKRETLWVRAAEVAANSKVKVWLDYAKIEATSKLLDETSYTLQAHLDELNQAIEFARSKGAAGPLIQAITSKGKACNHYTEHKEINVNNASDAKLIQSLESLLGHNAGMEAAKSLGYKLDDKHTEH